MVPKIFVADYATSVGAEWLPYSSWALVTLLPGAGGAYLLALALTNREEWRHDTARYCWALTATLYLVLLLKSRRFVEYFPPAALLTSRSPSRSRWRAWTSGASAGRRAVSRPWCRRPRPRVVAADEHHGGARGGARPTLDGAVPGGARWLANHTPAGSRVFHTDWDDPAALLLQHPQHLPRRPRSRLHAAAGPSATIAGWP